MLFRSVSQSRYDQSKVLEYLDELEFLAETAGAAGDKKFIQRLERPNNKTYVGSGKLDEIKSYITENEIKLVLLLYFYFLLYLLETLLNSLKLTFFIPFKSYFQICFASIYKFH